MRLRQIIVLRRGRVGRLPSSAVGHLGVLLGASSCRLPAGWYRFVRGQPCRATGRPAVSPRCVAKPPGASACQLPAGCYPSLAASLSAAANGSRA